MLVSNPSLVPPRSPDGMKCRTNFFANHSGAGRHRRFFVCSIEGENHSVLRVALMLLSLFWDSVLFFMGNVLEIPRHVPDQIKESLRLRDS